MGSDRAELVGDSPTRGNPDAPWYSTPTFVLNDLLVPGNTPVEFFESVVARVRENSGG